jgi:multiple sugar transport system permease protein
MAVFDRVLPKSKLARREALAFYIFISPWLIGFLAFVLYPTLATTVWSFAQYDVANIEYIGLGNYKELIVDNKFWWSLWVTAKYTIIGVPLNITVALAIAIVLNQKVPLLSFWRTIYYLPSVLAGVAVALLFRWLLNPEFGLINYFLDSLFGIEGPRWFFSETWAIPSYWIMGLWTIGGAMVIYLAGLQSVPTTLYEAAEIDGSNAWQKFRYITLPMISPVILFTLVTNLIFTLRTFTQVYVITNNMDFGVGGPNSAALMYMVYIFQNAFRWFRLGYASALAWILFAVTLGLTILLLRITRDLVYYESGRE